MDTEAIETDQPKFTYGEVIEGKIVMLNLEKGYGFILSDVRRFKRFFFHWSALRPETTPFDELTLGDKVRFTEAYSPEKGPRAMQIEVI